MWGAGLEANKYEPCDTHDTHDMKTGRIRVLENNGYQTNGLSDEMRQDPKGENGALVKIFI